MERYDVTVYDKVKGWVTVARCVSIYRSESIERERSPAHVSICRSIWEGTESDHLPTTEPQP